MTASIYAESIELLWVVDVENGLENRFLFPAAQDWERRFSTFAFFRRRLPVRAAFLDPPERFLVDIP